MALTSNQAYTKLTEIARPVANLTVSNNLTVGGVISGGPFLKMQSVPVATAAPTEATLIDLRPDQSGTTFLLTQSATGANDQVFVLPPAQVGLTYTFTVVDATSGSTISIMPFGYTVAGGNPTAAGNGVSEAYANSIQAIIAIGQASGGYATGAVSDQINSIAGSGNAAGGIMFTAGLAGLASLKLTCVSLSVTGAILTGCRWVGEGQAPAAQDIDVSA